MSSTVDAAAKAIARRTNMEWDHEPGNAGDSYALDARAALLAALPALSEGLAEVALRALHEEAHVEEMSDGEYAMAADSPADVSESVTAAITEELKRRIEG